MRKFFKKIKIARQVQFVVLKNLQVFICTKLHEKSISSYYLLMICTIRASQKVRWNFDSAVLSQLCKVGHYCFRIEIKFTHENLNFQNFVLGHMIKYILTKLGRAGQEINWLSIVIHSLIGPGLCVMTSSQIFMSSPPT